VAQIKKVLALGKLLHNIKTPEPYLKNQIVITLLS